MYRWGVDLLGDLHETTRGNKYVMIMIEHFSKWIEIAALPSKESQYTAQAFLERVVSRFGAPAEVVTDRGSEFEEAFGDLLQKCMIDHRTTSASHPQADGLAERAVQTVKMALRKSMELLGRMPLSFFLSISL
jgi:transposase-like protein